MRPQTVVKRLEKTAFWCRPLWSGECVVSIGKRNGIGVHLPRDHAISLAERLNAAITETRIAIQKEIATTIPVKEAVQIEMVDIINDVSQNEQNEIKQNVAAKVPKSVV